MKRRDLERHLRDRDCQAIREGANHTIWGRGERLAPMPRHRELSPGVVRTICKQLDVDPPLSAL